jgi:hypothetical protein
MLRLKIIFFAFLSAIILHIFLFFGFTLYVNEKLTPYILMWPEVLDKNYPSGKTVSSEAIVKNAIFIKGVNPEKSFFFSSLEKPEPDTGRLRAEKVSLFLDDFQNIYYTKKTQKSLYVWKKPESLLPQEKEVVSYKAFVSPHGKIVFSFPEKLTVNSSDNMSSQEYMRQASMFFTDKFFWTILEAVVR